MTQMSIVATATGTDVLIYGLSSKQALKLHTYVLRLTTPPPPIVEEKDPILGCPVSVAKRIVEFIASGGNGEHSGLFLGAGAGNKISDIKYVRTTAMGSGLKAAKDFVEYYFHYDYEAKTFRQAAQYIHA